MEPLRGPGGATQAPPRDSPKGGAGAAAAPGQAHGGGWSSATRNLGTAKAGQAPGHPSPGPQQGTDEDMCSSPDSDGEAAMSEVGRGAPDEELEGRLSEARRAARQAKAAYVQLVRLLPHEDELLRLCRARVEATRKALDAVRPATETLAALQASVRDRRAAVAVLRTKVEDGARVQQALCERLTTAQAGLQGAEAELESALAAEAERARHRQAQDPEAAAVEERAQLLATDPQAVAAAIAELDQMKGRLLAAAEQASPARQPSAEAREAEADSPKKANISIVDLLLRGNGAIPSGTGAAGLPQAAGASESSADLH